MIHYFCPGQYNSMVPHYYQKHAWGLQLIKWNYTAFFIEAGGHNRSSRMHSVHCFLLEAIVAMST